MARVEFQDFSIQVKDALDDAVVAYLYAAGEELKSQTQRHQTRIKSGETKELWKAVVDESKQICTIGNPLENAIWEEFGTGEYALEGNGRKGGWWYQDKDTGKWHFTTGKTPLRPLHTAFTKNKAKIIRMAEQVLKGRMN
jgi:hypothetical protein